MDNAAFVHSCHILYNKHLCIPSIPGFISIWTDVCLKTTRLTECSISIIRAIFWHLQKLLENTEEISTLQNKVSSNEGFQVPQCIKILTLLFRRRFALFVSTTDILPLDRNKQISSRLCRPSVNDAVPDPNHYKIRDLENKALCIHFMSIISRKLCFVYTPLGKVNTQEQFNNRPFMVLTNEHYSKQIKILVKGKDMK